MAINAGDDILATHFKGTRYYMVAPSDLAPINGATDWHTGHLFARSNHDTDFVDFHGGIHLPHGAVVTSFKVYWYRSDAGALGTAVLGRSTSAGVSADMADASSNSSAGYHSVEDTSIDNATIDNSQYSYNIRVLCDPNDDKEEVRFCLAVITYTVDYPLP